MTDQQRYTVTAPDESDSDGNFEIRLRLLGNEVFAISLTADPLNQRWISWAVLISFVTVIGLALLGDPLADFYGNLVNSDEVIVVE